MVDEELQATLDAFERDPLAAMNQLPEKRTVRGTPAPTPFQRAAIADASYVRDRDRVRARLHAPAAGTEEARIARNDRPENLVDELRHTKPAAMDAAGLTRAQLAESPWSDDYWGIYLGILGRRYADPAFPNSEDWQENFAYVQKKPAAQIVAAGDRAAIDRLSPSEKYDLLIGDARGTLTAAMWSEGRGCFESTGKVETWMGICHGWAPAAFTLARPHKVVQALAADGKTTLRFYPSDIKALASLLWANAGGSVRFIGGRCGEAQPKTDANGRLISGSAFDTNPGTWHQCIVNQIGVSKRSFVMDATYDYEVWNQPLFSYEYSYFNPRTRKLAATLSNATVARGDFDNDRFRTYRTSGYAAVVGVVMRTRYVVETSPSHSAEDMPSRDAVSEVIYHYDLELDGQGTIVGGEWYQNKHPDFLWGPERGAKASTFAEAGAQGDWSPAAPMPASWQRAAIEAASASAPRTKAAPLAKIVERLIELAAI